MAVSSFVNTICAASGRGFRALQTHDLPAALLAPLSRKAAAHALTVEAAIDGC